MEAGQDTGSQSMRNHSNSRLGLHVVAWFIPSASVSAADPELSIPASGAGEAG